MSNEVVQAQVVQATVIGAGETDLLKAPGQVDGLRAGPWQPFLAFGGLEFGGSGLR